MNYDYEQNFITSTLELSDFRSWDPPASLMKTAQIVAAFAGSLVLMVGVDFGTSQVLPTLIPAPFFSLASVLLNVATLVLCALAVTNAAGKPESALFTTRQDESQVKAALLGIFLAAPGTGGALLAAHGTSAVVGTLLGTVVGSVALVSIGFTAWLAADPEPALLGALPRRRAVSEAVLPS